MTAATILDGRYALVEEAGRGASGEVLRALDGLTGRVVAVKILHEKLVDAEARERFARETRILATIRNPHVVGYVGHGADPTGRPFVVVEWLEGEDLAQRQKRRPLTGAEIVDVVEQIADGLADIHALGVIHRDVKPSNVFLTDREGALHATVIDLGIASVGAEPGLTSHGTLIGTPSYMPPEQILGVGLTARSDVFSLGVVLYELITSTKPFSGDDVVTLVAKIALQDPPRVRDHLPSVPVEVDAIVARAMAKEPKDRFPSVTAFAEALASAPTFRSARELSKHDPGETSVARSRRDGDALTLSTGERRVVTAMFARLGDDGDGNRAQTAFDRVAALHGGSPHALLALARVAIFGGASSIGDEAQRAARAALALVRELPHVEVAIATGRGPTGVGVLSGDAIDRAADPKVDAPRRSPVRVDEPTARLLGDAFELVGDRGIVWLVGERRAGPRPRTLLGRPTPCVGRSRELAQLEALFDEVAAESVARAAIVVAPAGAGKSRVRQELAQKLGARSTAPLVIEGRGSAFAESAAFGLVGSAIRAFARLRDGEPTDRQLLKLGTTIPESERAALLPHVAQLAGVGSGRTRPGEDGAVVSDRLRDAFERWLGLLTDAQPVALLLEDLQWADAASLTLVDGALRNLALRPLFVLALARPEISGRFPNLWAARSPSMVGLPGLTRKASLTLVEAVAGDSLAEPVVEAILRRAEGNAFYLEELLRAALEGRGRGSPADAESEVEPPDTILGMVQGRLDALGPEPKRVLKAASVFGDAAWTSAIAEVLGPSDGDVALDVTLAGLVAREILDRQPEPRFSDETEYVFRSTLVREAAYELLLDADRERAHARAADWLERHGESESYVLARHFELGSANARAVPWYRRAAEQALYGGDFAVVIGCAGKATVAGATGETLGQLQLMVAEAERWRGDLRSALHAAENATKLLQAGTAEWFSALRELVAAHGRLGNKTSIAPIAVLVQEARAEPGAEGAQIAALVPAAVHCFYGGDASGATSLAARVEELAGAAVDLEPRARARVHQLRAVLASHRDAFEAAIAEQLAALEQFDLADDRRAATLVRSNLAFLLLQLGDVDRATSVLREALVDATQLGLGTIRPLVLQNLGVALAWRGKTDEAFAAQREAADAFRALADPRLEGASRVQLALLHLERGALDDAALEARAVIETGVEAIEVGARAVVARVLLVRGDSAAALEEARRSIATLERVKNVEELEVFSRLVFAEALEAEGHVIEARAALEQARARVDAKLEKLSAPAIRQSLVERVPEHARLFELLSARGP